MLILRVEVNAPEHAVQAVKECLAMELERFGDVKLISVEPAQKPAQQMSMNAWAASQGYREAFQRMAPGQ